MPLLTAQGYGVLNGFPKEVCFWIPWSWAMLTCGCLSEIKFPGLAADDRRALAELGGGGKGGSFFLPLERSAPPCVTKDGLISEHCHTFWLALKLGDN